MASSTGAGAGHGGNPIAAGNGGGGGEGGNSLDGRGGAHQPMDFVATATGITEDISAVMVGALQDIRRDAEIFLRREWSAHRGEMKAAINRAMKKVEEEISESLVEMLVTRAYGKLRIAREGLLRDLEAGPAGERRPVEDIKQEEEEEDFTGGAGAPAFGPGVATTSGARPVGPARQPARAVKRRGPGRPRKSSAASTVATASDQYFDGGSGSGSLGGDGGDVSAHALQARNERARRRYERKNGPLD